PPLHSFPTRRSSDLTPQFCRDPAPAVAGHLQGQVLESVAQFHVPVYWLRGLPVTVEPRSAHLPQLAHPPSREPATRLHFLLDLLVDSSLPVSACSFRCSSTRCKHRRKKSISKAC